MGNIMEGTHGAGQASKTGQPGGGVHGVLHRIRALDLARLTHMEHEYRSEAATWPVLPILAPQPSFDVLPADEQNCRSYLHIWIFR